MPKRCFFGKSVDITHICWTEIIQRVFNPNRSLGLAWILSFRRLDFVWLLTKKWARCLPNLGTLLTQHGHGAYPGWAELTTDSCPIMAYYNIRIPAFRLLPMHGKKNIAQEKDLSDILFLDTSAYFTTLMTRGATLLPSMRTRKTGALTSEREVRVDVICRDERRRPAVLYT